MLKDVARSVQRCRPCARSASSFLSVVVLRQGGQHQVAGQLAEIILRGLR